MPRDLKKGTLVEVVPSPSMPENLLVATNLTEVLGFHKAEIFVHNTSNRPIALKKGFVVAGVHRPELEVVSSLG